MSNAGFRHRENPLACPHCGESAGDCAPIRGATTPDPKPGDCGFCWSCLGGTRYDTGPLGNLVIRPLTPEEAAAAEPILRRLRAAAAESYTPEEFLDLTR